MPELQRRVGEEEAREQRFRNVDKFLTHAVLYELLPDQRDYVPGRVRIEYHADAIEHAESLEVVDPLAAGASYEQELLSRLTGYVNRNITIVVGGVGSGKTTTLRYLLHKMFHARRTGELLPGQSRCAHASCAAAFFYVDGHHISRNASEAEAVQTVLAHLYEQVTCSLLNAWLRWRAQANETPLEQPTPEQWQRLVATLVVSDTQYAQAARYLFPELHRVERLYSYPQHTSIGAIAANCDPIFDGFNAALSAIEASTTRHEQLVDSLLSFAVRDCPATVHLVGAVDNLDQLPTLVIDEVVDTLCRLFERKRLARLVIPLRASSVRARRGFVGLADYVYHYGPNCFEMMFRRLTKALAFPREQMRSGVFEIAREELFGAPSHDHLPWFHNPPSHDDLDFFIAALLLYRQLMWHGLQESIGSRDSQETPPHEGIHEQHHRLMHLTVAPAAARDLAQTIEALTGTNARAATRHASQFFHRLYHHPDPVAQRLPEVRGTKEHSVVLRPFGYLAEALLLDHNGVLHAERNENLFAPPDFSLTRRMPSLTSFRILKYLREVRRTQVSNIIAQLGQYGVPRSATIHALRKLHEPRYLVWFDSRSDPDAHASDEYVTVSERGAHYVENLDCRFDYLWACKAQIMGINAGGKNFRFKLDLAVSLLREIADVEWLQVMYRRAGKGSHETDKALIRGHRMHVLELLYRGVANLAALSAQVLRRYYSAETLGAPQLRRPGDQITAQMDIGTKLVEDCERYYRWAYGTDDFRLLYAEAREGAARALEGYRDVMAQTNEDAAVASTSRFLNLVRVQYHGAAYVDESAIGRPLKSRDEIVRRFARVGSGLIDISKIAAGLRSGLDEDVWIAERILAMKDTLGALGETLQQTVPPAWNVLRFLDDVDAQLAGLDVSVPTKGPAVGRASMRPLADARRELGDWRRRLQAAEYDVRCSGGYTEEEVEERKEKFNKQMEILRELSRRLNVTDEDAGRFDARWDI